jgi:hypothetical protein
MNRLITIMKKTTFVLAMAGLTALSLSASAQVTLTGTELNDLTYNAYNQTPTYNSTSAYAQFDGGGANLSELYYPGSAADQYWATVTVPNGRDGVSLGTLNSFISSGSTFDLKSLTGMYALGNDFNQIISPYWVVTLNIPAIDGGGTVSYSSAADGVLGANTFDQLTSGNPGTGGEPSPLDYFTGSGPYNSLGSSQQLNANSIATWASLAATEGTWSVASVAVELGNWPEQYSLDAEIDSFNLPGDPSVPDAASTLSLLGICFGAMAGLRRRLNRA